MIYNIKSIRKEKLTGTSTVPLFYFPQKDIFFISFRERGREREKHRLVASHSHPDRDFDGGLYAPGPVMGPTTYVYDPTGNQTGNLLVTGRSDNQLSHTGQDAASIVHLEARMKT